MPISRLSFQKHLTHGFSLIELSVIISVAAALAVGFMAWNNNSSIVTSQQSIITQRRIKEIASAIENFRINYGRLPCPADPKMREDETYLGGSSNDLYPNNFGTEDLNTSSSKINGVKTLGVDCPNSIGSVPIYSLGLNDNYLVDGWNRRFTYHVSEILCGSDLGVDIVGNDASLQKGCSKYDYTNNNGNLVVEDGNKNVITENAAYILISYGVNSYGANLTSGELNTASTNDLEIENYNGDNIYIVAQHSLTNSYDDIVFYQTKPQIEQLISKKDSLLISDQKCQDNSSAIGKINTDYMTSIRSKLTGYQQSTYNTGDQLSLGILLNLQEACINYYGSAATSGIWKGPKCPGTGIYYTDTRACECPTGNWENCCPGGDLNACLDS